MPSLTNNEPKTPEPDREQQQPNTLPLVSNESQPPSNTVPLLDDPNTQLSNIPLFPNNQSQPPLNQGEGIMEEIKFLTREYKQWISNTDCYRYILSTMIFLSFIGFAISIVQYCVCSYLKETNIRFSNMSCYIMAMMVYLWGFSAVKFQKRERHRGFAVLLVMLLLVEINLLVSVVGFERRYPGVYVLMYETVGLMVLSSVVMVLAVLVSLGKWVELKPVQGSNIRV